MVAVDNSRVTEVDGSDAPPADDAATAGADAPTVRVWRDPFVLIAATLVVLPVIAAALSALRTQYVPTNDWALIELEVRRVGGGDTPLIGAWSRFGWKHPGPLPFYLLAGFYRLVPSDRGILFAAAAVNGLAVVGFTAVMMRQTRSRALMALLGLALVEKGMGIRQLSDPWNPTLPILPFALYLALCLEVARGNRSRWPMPAALAVASFVVQAHVGFLQPVVLTGAAAMILRGRRLRLERVEVESADADADAPKGWAGLKSRIKWRPTLVSAGVVAVLWLPTLIDQVNGTGNMGTLIRWSLGDEQAAAGGMGGGNTDGRLPIDRVLNAGAWLLEPFGLWLGRFRPLVFAGYPLMGRGEVLSLLWIPAIIVVTWAVIRLGRPGDADRRAVTAALVLAGVGVVSVWTDLLSARGIAVFWPFRWAITVVMLLWVALGWAVVGALARRFAWIDGPIRWRQFQPGPIAAGAVAVITIAVPIYAALFSGSLGSRPEQVSSAALLRLRSTIVENAGQEDLVVVNTTVMFNPDDLGLPVVLDRAGIPWVDHSDPRAGSHDRYNVLPASDLNGLTGAAIALGMVELLGRSGPPRPGEPPDSELILIRAPGPPP